MSIFGEDFLIKLGFDVDNDKLKKLRKELAKFKKAGASATRNKALDREVKQMKQLTSLERKRLAMRKKIDRLQTLGHKGKLTDPNRFKKGASLDKRNVELDEMLRITTKSARNAAEIEKKSAVASAKELKRAAEIAAARIRQAVGGLTQGSGLGRGSAKGSLLAEMLRGEEAKSKSNEKQIAADRRQGKTDEKEVLRKRKEGITTERRIAMQRRMMLNDFTHAFAAFGVIYAGFTAIRDSQQVKFAVETSETQMKIAFGDDSERMMDKFVSSVKELGLGIGKVASLEALSQIAPALKGRFSEDETNDMSKNLLVVSTVTGQLKAMPAIARNLAQISTSLEGEDINQFADRFTGFMPSIYEEFVKRGDIETASRGDFMKAKTAGKIQSKEFMEVLKKVLGRVANDKDLLEEISTGKLNVAFNTMLATIDDARLAFMGDFSKDGKTSLSEQLGSTYESFNAFFTRSERTWAAWGEVIGSVISGLTEVFFFTESLYLNFALFLKSIMKTFGMSDEDADDAARRGAIWTALGIPMLLVGSLFVGLAIKLKGLLGILGIFGAGTAAASGGFIASVSIFALSVASYVTGTAAIVATIALLKSLFVSNDGGYGIAKALGIEDYVPDWMMQGIGGDNEFDKLLDEEDAYKKQRLINDTGGMYQELGMSPREKATKYGMGKSGEAAYQKSLVDNKTITNTFNINEAENSQSTVKDVSSYLTRAFEYEGLFNTLNANM